MPQLFDELKLGELTLRNRILLAPLTRARSGPERIPNDLNAEYYAQRASAGLIITEATIVAAQGAGYADTPGIWSAAQVEGWRKVTQAVHAAGGLIFSQLWHVGRVSHPIFLDGELPVAPSAIAPKGTVSLIRPQTEYPVPRALRSDEIPGIVAAFAHGARNARRAGFDGVELHGANGYLLDQFLQDGSNRRDDQYGGSIENRARLLLECTDAAIAEWGAGRVGVHLAPRGDSHDMHDSQRAETFRYVARELGKRAIAFICARESRGPDSLGPALKKAFGGAYVMNEGFDQTGAELALAEGSADAVAFGKAFLANPDLPRRFALNAQLNTPDPRTFYGGGAKGYVDYPALSADAARAAVSA
jgi:2,4-dienoyl-CoA reductase-like NADH-dependent reductase (Old Yellow Enzyme family)